MRAMSRLVTAAAPFAVALHSGLAAAQHNLPPPVTPIAREIYDLHLLMLGICAVILVGVFSVMFYSIYAHRKSVGHKAVPFHENTTVEIVWTIIPFFILIGMAWPATKTVLALKDSSNPDITIKASGRYAAWVADQKRKMAAAADDPAKSWDLADLRARGEKVYAANCVACHQANGMGVPNAFPALAGSKMVNGPKGEQIAMVLDGKQGTAMQAFGKQISDTDIAAAITYTRNTWGNKAQDNIVQPADVKAVRK